MNGNEIRAARDAKGMTQAELADAVGTSQQTIDRIEREQVKHTRYLPKICEMLGLRSVGDPTSVSPLQVLRTILCANPTAEQVLAALEANGLKIVGSMSSLEDGLERLRDGVVGRRVAEIRSEKKISQEELAEAIDCHWVTISKLERNEMALSVEWLLRLARGLDVSPEELMKGDAATEIDDPVGFIQGIIDRRGITASRLCKACGIAASTLNRAMKPDCKFVLSARILKKIKEWDLAQ